MSMQDTTLAKRFSTSLATFPWHDIRLILAAALVLIGLIALEQWLWFLAPVRLVLGFIFVLYVPGYCMQAALFVRKDDLDNIERFGLSLSLSVAVVPILAFILDRLPSGLFLWPLVFANLLTVLLFSAMALWRRVRVPANERYAPTPVFRPRQSWQSLQPIEKRIYQAAAVLGTILLVTFVWVFAVPSNDEFMTEFYILGAEGQAESYPRNPTVNEALDVTMGIVNRERTPQTYRVEVWVTWAWDPDAWWTQVAEVGPLPLERGERLEQPLTWEMPWDADDVQVYFWLYREGDEEPYRELLLWMDVQDAPES